MTEHDKAIIEAAERYADEFGCLVGPALSPKAHAIVAAVAAKREAERPKLLTAQELACIFYRRPDSHTDWLPETIDKMQQLLDAAHERALKVIEATPRYTAAVPMKESTPPTPYDAAGSYVALYDIRRALQVKP